MTTITKDFARKIISGGGVYDTRRYRYVATNDRPGFERIKLDCAPRSVATRAARLGRLSFGPHGLGCAGSFVPCSKSRFSGPLRVLLVGRYPYTVPRSRAVPGRCGALCVRVLSGWFRCILAAIPARSLVSVRFPRGSAAVSVWVPAQSRAVPCVTVCVS